MTSANAVVEGFDWAALPEGSVVVDVGGGVGSHSLALAKAFYGLNFVVQDRPSVMAASAPNYWSEHFPAAISSGRVTLQAHDFFEPQPVREPAVFLLRTILHDWADEHCIKILRYLRAAAGPETQLVIIDSLVVYACETPKSVQEIPGATTVRPPSLLLPNMGVAGSFPYLTDMQMMLFFNATERTVLQFAQLLDKSGWRLVRVSGVGGSFMQGAKLIATPT